MVDLSPITFIPVPILGELSVAMKHFNINTVLRASHFLSQCQHESANFTKTEENLNYSAVSLMNTFPKHFASLDTATAYARQPEKIANHVYANRMGNGDESSGDGWKYKGAGFIQITGHDNYKAFGDAISEDIVSKPQLLTTPQYAALSAAWFFSKHGLNEVADTGSDDAVVQKITKVINGGLNGITQRTEDFHKIYTLLSTTVA